MSPLPGRLLVVATGRTLAIAVTDLPRSPGALASVRHLKTAHPFGGNLVGVPSTVRRPMASLSDPAPERPGPRMTRTAWGLIVILVAAIVVAALLGWLV